MKRNSIQIDKSKFDRQELIAVLDKLKPALATKAIVEQTTHYLFMKDRIATYNDEMCCAEKYPIGFSGSVKAEEFYKLLSKSSAKKVDLDLQEGQVKVRVGSSSFGLAYMEEGEAHKKVSSLGHDELKWRPLPEDLKNGLILCSFSASKDMTRPALTGVYVSGDNVLSSDNYRISWYRLHDELRRKFLLPASSVVHLVNYDVNEYCLTDSWMHFREGDFVFSTRLLSEEFPEKAKEFFPEEVGECFELPQEMGNTLDKALVLLQDDFLLDKEVSITFSQNEVVCDVKKKDVGWLTEKTEMEAGPKEDVSIKVNPIFLKEILKKTTKLSVISEDKILFMSDNFKHLIAL